MILDKKTMEIEKKICCKCKRLKGSKQYYFDSRNEDGLRSICNLCLKSNPNTAGLKDWAQPVLSTKETQDPIKKQKERSDRLYREYKITSKQYQSMLEKQSWACAICKETEKVRDKEDKIKKLAVDHNHITGKVRGLLCSKCNMGIGLLRTDEGINILQAAIDYINITDTSLEEFIE